MSETAEWIYMKFGIRGYELKVLGKGKGTGRGKVVPVLV
jgi:hypothetical protein